MDSGGSGGVSVLIVEDDEAMAAVAQAWLRVDRGFVRVEQVGSVHAARSWLVDHSPDVVVLDPALPDGAAASLTHALPAAPAADVLDALRAHDSRAAVVLYTSHADFADLGRALGCDA